MPPQLEKNHVVPTSWQDEALARDGVSREVPCSALKGEMVPDSLAAPGEAGGASMPSFPPKNHLSSTTYPAQWPMVHMLWEPISLQC